MATAVQAHRSMHASCIFLTIGGPVPEAETDTHACRSLLIKERVEALRSRAVAASLQQSVAGMQAGEGTAGGFLRFARRTIVRGDGTSVPTSQAGQESATSTTVHMQAQ